MRYWWVLLLLVPFVLAECADGEVCAVEESPAFFPESFDYVNGDYAVVDWNTVDWTRIPPERIQHVPPDRLAYEALSTAQRFSMTPTQIQFNFNKIEDLTSQVDKEKAKVAINSGFKVKVKRIEGPTKVRGSKLSSGSTEIDLGTSIARSSEIKIDTLRSIDTGELSQKMLIVPYQHCDSFGEGKYSVFFGKEPITVNGKRYNSGEIEVGDFLPQSAWITIEGTRFASGKKFYIVDDPKELETPEGEEGIHGIYVSKDRIVAKTWTDGEDIKTEGVVAYSYNNININLGTKFGSPGLEEKKKLTIFIIKVDGIESSVDYQKREGKVPLIVTKGDVDVTSGRADIKSLEGKIEYRMLPERRKIVTHPDGTKTYETIEVHSTPLVLQGKNMRLVTDSKNNILTTSTEREEFECTSCALDFGKSTVALHQAKGRFTKDTGIKLEGAIRVQDIPDLNTKLGDLPPTLQKSIKEIHLVEDVQKHCGKKSAGCMSWTNRMIVHHTPSEAILAHEAGHGFHNNQNEQDRKAKQNSLTLHYKRLLEKKYGVELVVQDGKLIEREFKGVTINKPRYRRGRFISVKYEELGYVDYSPAPITSEEAAEFKKLYDSDKVETFEDQWKAVAKIDGKLPYGVGLGPKVVAGVNAEEWAKLSTEKNSRGPGKGCIRAYGCNNIEEDIATHIECAHEACYIDLIHEESGEYEWGSQEHKIHCSKFKILCDRGGISKEGCDDIKDMCSW